MRLSQGLSSRLNLVHSRGGGLFPLQVKIPWCAQLTAAKIFRIQRSKTTVID